MQALQFWKAVALDEANMLEGLVGLFEEHAVAYCVIGGQAVNAYVEPLVSNLSLEGSGLRAQIQTDPRYATFLERAERRDVLGLALPVASIEDTLQGKVWAVTDPTRRASKRQKDLADIARILEAGPALRSRVPEAVLGRLMG